jgi:CheY-like chemotaxis protein/predicted Ser/Thr protein kinase
MKDLGVVISSETEESLDPTKPWSEDKPAVVPSVRLGAGDVIARRYRVEQKLGEGGMGAVYRVRDLELEEALAIKVLAPATGDADNRLARFKQETRLARRVLHPNVCHIYDFGSWGDLHFVTMELLPGRTLHRWMEESAGASLEDKLELFRGILAGIGAAHELGIVHRDIKPQNVMISDDGRPVVMDFGIARELESTGLTAAGEVLGTPEYMAPERLLAEECDHRCDVYSLGVLLYELLTGVLPFDGETVFEIARNQICQEPPSAAAADPRIPLHLDRLILAALAKQPEERIQSIAEMLARLDGDGDLPALPGIGGEKAAAEAERSAPRVVFIGEKPGFLHDVESYLAHGGVEVLTARTGAEGIDRVLQGGADLVCLDFRLPEMDGFQAAACLRRFETDRKIPIFMVATSDDGRYEKQAVRAGIERFFTQPVDVGSFLTALSEQLAA